MQKHSINLIISKPNKIPHLDKIKTYMPVVALLVLVIFIGLYIYSTINLSNANKEYLLVKSDVDSVEKKIRSQNNIEGIYLLTANRLEVISQILSKQDKDFAKFLNEIQSYDIEGIILESVGIDKKGLISMQISASSSASLDELVSLLIRKDNEKFYSKITSGGISRDKTGTYKMTVSYTGSKAIF